MTEESAVRRRGPAPDIQRAFGQATWAALARAAHEVSWLLGESASNAWRIDLQRDRTVPGVAQ